MNAPITYFPLFWKADKASANAFGEALNNEVQWVQRDRTPRREAFYSKVDAPYTYGSGNGIRTYEPDLNVGPLLKEVWDATERWFGPFEACFLNKYDHAREHLGWHADDSEVIDDTRPIAVISFGEERELWFRENGSSEVEKLLLETGSLCLMLPGMQDTHQHRIPKAGRECGTRISLTFRGLLS